MAVRTHAQYGNIKTAVGEGPAQILFVAKIAVGQADRHGMDLGRRNGHLVDQRGSNHGEVQPRIAIRHASLVDQPQVGARPVACGVARISCQQLVEPFRANTAREGQVCGAGLFKPLAQ